MKYVYFIDGTLNLAGDALKVAEALEDHKEKSAEGRPVKDCTTKEFLAMIHPQAFVEQEEKGT